VFTPVVAGIGAMHSLYFMGFNLVGARIWALGVTLGGNSLGGLIPGSKIDTVLPLISGARRHLGWPDRDPPLARERRSERRHRAAAGAGLGRAPLETNLNGHGMGNKPGNALADGGGS